MCTLLGYSKDVPQGDMGGGNSHNDDDESKCINAMDIHLNLLVMAYLHASDVLVGLAPKEQDRIIHRVKQFWWEGNSLLWVWINGWIWVVPRPEQHEGFVQHAHEKLGHFGVQWTYNLLQA